MKQKKSLALGTLVAVLAAGAGTAAICGWFHPATGIDATLVPLVALVLVCSAAHICGCGVHYWLPGLLALVQLGVTALFLQRIGILLYPILGGVLGMAMELAGCRAGGKQNAGWLGRNWPYLVAQAALCLLLGVLAWLNLMDGFGFVIYLMVLPLSQYALAAIRGVRSGRFEWLLALIQLGMCLLMLLICGVGAAVGLSMTAQIGVPVLLLYAAVLFAPRKKTAQ